MPLPHQQTRDRGAVIPIVALLLPVLIIMTSFAVDLGRQRLLRRDLQADADVIALDLVRLANGRTTQQIEETDPGAYVAYVNGSFTRNGLDLVSSLAEARQRVAFGTWDPSGPQPFDATGDPPNAVQVSLDGVLDYYFQPGDGRASRSAIATRTDRGGFSIGSYAAAVASGNSGMLNALLGNALGLGVLGYDGLATAQVSLLDIAAELGGLTPEELFSGDVSAADALGAAATILRRDDPTSAQADLLDGILTSDTSADIVGDVALSDALHVAPGGEQAAAQSNVNLLDLLAASAFLANGAGLAIPSVELGLPGFRLEGQLALIQAPATAYGPLGTSVDTSQLSTTLKSTTGTLALGDFPASTLNSVLPGAPGSMLCGLLSILPLLCGTSSHPVTAELVVTVGLDLASATGTIDHIRCTDVAEELGVAVDSQLASTSIDVELVLKSGSTELGKVKLDAANTRQGLSGAGVDFLLPPDLLGVYKDAAPASGPLVGPTQLNGTGALGPLLTTTLSAQLNGIVTSVNQTVVTPLASLLGVSVASARVAARAVDCGGGQLVA